MKKFLRMSKQGILILFVVVGCLCFNNQAKVYAKKPKVQISDKKVYIGEYEDYKVLKLKGTKKKPKWSSNKKSVVTVNKKGRINTKKKGTAVITAKLGKKKYKCNVIVERPYLSPDKTSILVGESKQLYLYGTKRKATSWGVSFKEVASISSKGVVKGVSAESTNVWAKIGKEYYFGEVQVRDLKLNTTQLKVGVGYRLSSLLNIHDGYEDIDSNQVTWESSNPNIAIVNPDGRVIGCNKGETTIIATYKNKKMYCKVTVNYDYNYADLKNFIKSHGIKKNGEYWYYDSENVGNNIYHYMTLMCDDNSDIIYVNMDVAFATWYHWMYTFALDPNDPNTIVKGKCEADGNREYSILGNFNRDNFHFRSDTIYFKLLSVKNLKVTESSVQNDANDYFKKAINSFEGFLIDENIFTSGLGLLY